MNKKPLQKLKCLENEKSFQEEIKSIFHHFCRTFNEANNAIFLGTLESDFNGTILKLDPRKKFNPFKEDLKSIHLLSVQIKTF